MLNYWGRANCNVRVRGKDPSGRLEYQRPIEYPKFFEIRYYDHKMKLVM
jgi:hypothetical protein